MRSKNQAVKSWLCPNEISWSAGLCPNRKPIANSSGCVQTESRLKRAGFAHTETCWKAGFVQTESRLQRAGHIQTSHTQDKEASASFFVSFCIFVLCCERFSRRIPVTRIFLMLFWCFFFDFCRFLSWNFFGILKVMIMDDEYVESIIAQLYELGSGQLFVDYALCDLDYARSQVTGRPMLKTLSSLGW